MEKPEKQLRKQVKRKLPEGMAKKMFKPGQSGNPNGRPKKGLAISDILNNKLDEMKGDKETREILYGKVLEMALSGDKWAIEFVADRTEGKAVERVQKQKIKDEIELL